MNRSKSEYLVKNPANLHGCYKEMGKETRDQSTNHGLLPKGMFAVMAIRKSPDKSGL